MKDLQRLEVKLAPLPGHISNPVLGTGASYQSAVGIDQGTFVGLLESSDEKRTRRRFGACLPAWSISWWACRVDHSAVTCRSGAFTPVSSLQTCCVPPMSAFSRSPHLTASARLRRNVLGGQGAARLGWISGRCRCLNLPAPIPG
jgi:hypothetical protein